MIFLFSFCKSFPHFWSSWERLLGHVFHTTDKQADAAPNLYWLVVWNIFLFFNILGIVTPTDEYFSEGLKPPTSISHNIPMVGLLIPHCRTWTTSEWRCSMASIGQVMWELYVGDHGMPEQTECLEQIPSGKSTATPELDEKLCFIVRCPLNHVKTVKILELKVIEHDSENDSP